MTVQTVTIHTGQYKLVTCAHESDIVQLECIRLNNATPWIVTCLGGKHATSTLPSEDNKGGWDRIISICVAVAVGRQRQNYP